MSDSGRPPWLLSKGLESESVAPPIDNAVGPKPNLQHLLPLKSTRLLIGFHAVTARLRQHADSIAEILLDPQRNDPRVGSLKALAAERGVRLNVAVGTRLD